MTFANNGDSFFHQVNDTTSSCNDDMHCWERRVGEQNGLTLFLSIMSSTNNWERKETGSREEG